MVISPSAKYNGQELTTNGRCSSLIPARTPPNESPIIVVGKPPSPTSSRMVGAQSGAVVIAERLPGSTPGPRSISGKLVSSLYSGDRSTVSNQDSASHSGTDESAVTDASGSCTHSALPKYSCSPK